MKNARNFPFPHRDFVGLRPPTSLTARRGALALVRQHKANPRGLIVYFDELIGFIYSFNDTCIGVFGGIQPEILVSFAKGKIQNGFVDRWLFAFPEKVPYPKFNDIDIDERTFKRWLSTSLFRKVTLGTSPKCQ